MGGLCYCAVRKQMPLTKLASPRIDRLMKPGGFAEPTHNS